MHMIQLAPVMVYHGTSSENLARIQAEGLKPNAAKGADEWSRKMTGWAPENRDSVYLTTDPAMAGSFAHIASTVAGGNPVVLAIMIPPEMIDRVTGDEFAPSVAYRFPGNIDPSWIKWNGPADPDTRTLVSAGFGLGDDVSL